MEANFDILEANLQALALTEPAFARRLRETTSAPLEWTETRTASLSASTTIQGKRLSLASRFDPDAEAVKLLADVDLAKHAGIVCLGFGLGYHVAQLAEQVDQECLVVVFEPDVSLLRAVLERIDHSHWLGRPWFVFADETTDRASLLQRLERQASTLTQGTILVPHPPTRQLHQTAVNDFGRMVSEVISFCRTSVATALVNASRTVRNLSLNLPHYAAGATTNELHNVAAGFPAVCVSAGPSLAKNIDLLSDESVRKNVVVITAQTTLKPLLDRGIRPDFVTALDYHEISKRFYEGLPPLPDVTLVAEPKGHPTIIDHFPGPVRMPDSGLLDMMLGSLARPRVPVRDGATVAHLSFYLAQHLGCDPIIFVGQDLGFSEGLYYCPGTAIHDVWANELGPFNTLEMMEWQRVVRHRSHLQRMTDIHGQTIFSDEQMITYLKQFERDFSGAPQTIIDATEGGLPKEGTERMALREALDTHATGPVPGWPMAKNSLDAQRLSETHALIATRIDEVRQLKEVSGKTIPILRQMMEHQCDAVRMDKLFKRLEKQKSAISKLNVTFDIVNNLNTIGVFKRSKADRAIRGGTDDSPLDRQRLQLERDLVNIDWLVQAYDESLEIFTAALERVAQKLNQQTADTDVVEATAVAV